MGWDVRTDSRVPQLRVASSPASHFFFHVTITHGTLNAGIVAVVAVDPLDDTRLQASVRRTTATRYPKRTPILEG